MKNSQRTTMTKEELLILLGSWENLRVVRKSQSDLTPFLPRLMEIAMEGNGTVNWRAAWLADRFTFENPELLHPYARKLISNLPTITHSGKKRQFLRLIACIPVDPESAGFLFDYCQKLLFIPDEKTAVKVYAMQILYNISRQEPELKGEVIQTLEQVIDQFSGAGIVASARNTVNRLMKEIHKR